ncbi:MAG: ATP-dependent protease ATPase subunit HslU [Phycisphaerales bacterium]
MKELTPREIVAELDRFIIGQDNAKRAVAVAVRNRWRRRQLEPEMAREVAPKNIIMIGPTGVGKTEIARRLSNLVNAPFIKVEASKYTEVGYHGRDVESMIRDLLELAVDMVRSEHAEKVREQAEESVESRLVSLLLGEATATTPEPWRPPSDSEAETSQEIVEPDSREHVRNRLRDKLREGIFEDREIEISIQEKQVIPVIGMMGPDQMDPAISSMLENLVPSKTRHRRVTVARARTILLEEETNKLIDNEKIMEQAIERTEQMGIVFLDEIDKIAAPGEGKVGSADVSRQGVQRDLLPIVEGSAVNTRYGVVHTDQILFIAAGAFHSTSVSDLMPELQGRFPIRVELDPLNKDDFKRILVEPDSALTKQQQALLATEGVTMEFEPESIDAMAELAAEANNQLENIGARRLITVIECVFEQISFDAPEFTTKSEKHIEISAEFVRERLTEIMKDEDLSKFVL